jgi:serine/threonine-protein kinase
MDWETFYNAFRKPDFISGYEIQNRLGGGAFGEVYKARKASIGKAYAIKFLKIDDEAQREAVERELEQVRHFAAIDHPNLVSIEDLGSVMDVPYLIMGYAGEDTLARRLKGDALDRDSAVLYFVQVCRGVLALHDRRLVHFDLKPSNVFLKGDIARVGDYGLSKMMTDGRQTLSFGRGTPQYMAPEMIKSRADHRADVYSLGVMLYESLTGELPFKSEVPGAVVMRDEDLPPPFAEDFPARLRPVVERCLHLAPEDRYESLADLLEDLGQTARPGDSVRIAPGAGGVSSAAGHVPSSEAGPTPVGGIDDETPSPARNTAAQLTRGAVEVARGMWDGLRTASGSGAAVTTEREDASSSGGAVTPPPLPTEPSQPADPRTPTKPPLEAKPKGPSATSPEPKPAPSAPPKASGGEPLAMHGLSKPVEAGSDAPSPAVAAGPGTIPVPPRVEGGLWQTIVATLALGVEVMLSMAQWLVRRVPGGLGRSGSRLLRGAGGFAAGVARLGLFALLLFVLGAVVALLLLLLIGYRP